MILDARSSMLRRTLLRTHYGDRSSVRSFGPACLMFLFSLIVHFINAYIFFSNSQYCSSIVSVTLNIVADSNVEIQFLFTYR